MRKLTITVFLLTGLSAFASQEGLASWYGGKFQGRRTASGEIFDTNKLTAAHKTIPFGTLVRVINLENGKSAIVRINDRGPFVEGRIIDLSRAAALELGMTGRGVARVRIEPFENSVPTARYLIQLGAYREDENARAIVKRLEGSSLEAVIEITPAGIYRVLIRNLDEEALKSAREKLRRLGFGDFLVRRERSP